MIREPTPVMQIMAARMNEVPELTRHVHELWRVKYAPLGVLLWHHRPARVKPRKQDESDGPKDAWRTAGSGSHGFPDDTFAYCGGVMFRELKSQHANLTPAEEFWAAQLPSELYDIWRPLDLLTGRIEHELTEFVRRYGEGASSRPARLGSYRRERVTPRRLPRPTPTSGRIPPTV